jgi:hypothetical protein
MDIYGVLVNGTHTDVSTTEKGAKIYATKHGYDIITIRYNCGYVAEQIAHRKANKWYAIINN